MIHIVPDASATDCDRAGRRIDSGAFDCAQDPSPDRHRRSQYPCVVTAAADGDNKSLSLAKFIVCMTVATSVHRAINRGFLMDDAVVDLAGFIDIGVARLNQPSAKGCFRPNNRYSLRIYQGSSRFVFSWTFVLSDAT